MRNLILAAVILRVCWGPLDTQCGDFLGRYKTTVGGTTETINYYVVRTSDKAVRLVEPDLIIAVNRKEPSR